MSKHKKGYVSRKCNFFNIRARKFHFRKYKELFSQWILFFFFFGGGALTGMCEVALKYNTNSSSDETSLGVTTIARSISHRYPNMEVIVSGLLPRDIHWSKQGVKINNANAYLRDYYKKSNKKTFMRQEPDWTLPDNSLNIWNYIIKFTFTWLKTETPNSQTLKHCRSYYHQSS